MKNTIMKTSYVEATIQHQEDLRDIRNFLKQILGYDNDHNSISPINYTYTENTDSACEEIILNQKFSLNTTLVHFQLIDRPTSDENGLDEVLPKLFFQHYSWEHHKNPAVSGLNFIDGVHNLAEKLKHSFIATRKPPFEQSKTGRIFSDLNPVAYAWDFKENKFMRIALLKHKDDSLLEIKKLVDTLQT